MASKLRGIHVFSISTRIDRFGSALHASLETRRASSQFPALGKFAGRNADFSDCVPVSSSTLREVVMELQQSDKREKKRKKEKARSATDIESQEAIDAPMPEESDTLKTEEASLAREEDSVNDKGSEAPTKKRKTERFSQSAASSTISSSASSSSSSSSTSSAPKHYPMSDGVPNLYRQAATVLEQVRVLATLSLPCVFVLPVAFPTRSFQHCLFFVPVLRATCRFYHAKAVFVPYPCKNSQSALRFLVFFPSSLSLSLPLTSVCRSARPSASPLSLLFA